MESKILINGELTSQLNVADRGFQYGDGIFTTLVYKKQAYKNPSHKNGILEYWHEHMQRLQNDCRRLQLTAVAPEQWLEDIQRLQPAQDAVIKLSISRGVSGRGYRYNADTSPTRVCAIYPWPDYDPANEQGITARVCHTPVSVNPALAGVKHFNRLDSVLARNEWSETSIAEGLLLDEQGHVVEGTMSNVFCVLDNELYTPALNRAGVAGIMRQQVLNLAQQMQIRCHIVDISLSNLLSMDEVFVTNSLIKLWPLRKIIQQDKTLQLDTPVLALQLQQALAEQLSGLELASN